MFFFYSLCRLVGVGTVSLSEVMSRGMCSLSVALNYPEGVPLEVIMIVGED